ncbi:hypothetical protein L2E82_14790 [Cichorium intybus]|uniref:Uncharacterized protein n=1 Tax=Cichorium intybus TaxID=13427 RepID=A0ACB9F0M4_CICIN|nr:hypothetical protein L2E82_14790 [Cichorium intybus]
MEEVKHYDLMLIEANQVVDVHNVKRDYKTMVTFDFRTKSGVSYLYDRIQKQGFPFNKNLELLSSKPWSQFFSNLCLSQFHFISSHL